mgnify:FL=1
MIAILSEERPETEDRRRKKDGRRKTGGGRRKKEWENGRMGEWEEKMCRYDNKRKVKGETEGSAANVNCKLVFYNPS